MKAGEFYLIENLDHIDFETYPDNIEAFVIGKKLEYTGAKLPLEMYDNYDENDEPLIEDAYEFIYNDNEGMANVILLFRDNFSTKPQRKKKCVTETEFLDAFQRNFKE